MKYASIPAVVRCCLLLVLSVGAGRAGWLPLQAAEPANPKATKAARAILEYFYGLEKRTDKRIVSGQFSDFGNGAGLKIMKEIQEKTGEWPGMIGVDYADFSRGALTTATPNRAAIDHWKRGGLVHVSAHMYNPANANGGGLRDKGVGIAELLVDGTETHTRWMKQLDEMAAGLQELRDSGVVVLWRPFHEMNGGWFWWGAQDFDAFIKVWRHMFDYFTRAKGLDNLLWVYGPNHGNNTARYYAGDRYVDIIGLDAYTDFIDPEHIKGYQEVAALPKPFGFSEFGPFGSRNPPGDYDYRRFLEGVRKNFPRTVYFMSWNGKWSLAANNFTREMLAEPAVVNLDDLPPR